MGANFYVWKVIGKKLLGEVFLPPILNRVKTKFYCSKGFALSWLDKVTNGKSSSVSVIGNVHAPFELVIMQFHGHFNRRLTSQLISSITRVFQIFLKYFNGTALFTYFASLSLGVFLVIFTLNLYGAETVKIAFGSFL